MKRFRAGPLFNRVFHNFNLTLQGKIGAEQGRLLYLISGHDHTLTSFLDTLQLYSNTTRPSFASAIILELHRSQNNQQLQIKVKGHHSQYLDNCNKISEYFDLVILQERDFATVTNSWVSESLPIL